MWQKHSRTWTKNRGGMTLPLEATGWDQGKGDSAAGGRGGGGEMLNWGRKTL